MHLGDTPHNLTESDFEYLASRTEGFSGSDISVCVSFNFCYKKTGFGILLLGIVTTCKVILTSSTGKGCFI